MPQWNETIEVSDVFHNDVMTFEEKRDEIVKRVKASQWYKDSEVVPALVDDLSEAVDVKDFDYWWNQLYDYADLDRVWIATF